MNAARTASLQWDRMFKVLCIFHRTHDHCRVPPNPRRRSLGYWLVEQIHNHRAGQLSPEQFRQLDALGVFPEEKSRANSKQKQASNQRWETQFAKLLAYKRRFGHCDVPCHWKKDRLFGHWVSNQRSFRNKGILSPDPSTDVGDDVRSLKSKAKLESRHLDSYGPTKVGRVWINDRQYIEGVPETAWSFPIGGYLPAQRWLKDRIGRTLGYDEREEYQRIILALIETKRLMAEIDATIKQHGGWPLK